MQLRRNNVCLATTVQQLEKKDAGLSQAVEKTTELEQNLLVMVTCSTHTLKINCVVTNLSNAEVGYTKQTVVTTHTRAFTYTCWVCLNPQGCLPAF